MVTLMPTAYIASDVSPKHHSWVMDSGCSHHMTPMHDSYISYSPYITLQTVQLANKFHINAVGEGTVLISTVVDGITCCIQVEDVIHAPELSNSLLSVKVLNRRGFEVLFKDGIGRIVNPSGDVLARSKDGGSLYDLHTLREKYNPVMASIAHKPAHLSLDLIH